MELLRGAGENVSGGVDHDARCIVSLRTCYLLLLHYYQWQCFCHHIDEDALDQWFSPGVTLPPREHMEMSGGIFGSHSWGHSQGVPLVWSGKRPRMMLNILQGTGDPWTTKDYPAQNVHSAKFEKPCFRPDVILSKLTQWGTTASGGTENAVARQLRMLIDLVAPQPHRCYCFHTPSSSDGS